MNERSRRVVVVSNVDVLYANGSVGYLCNALSDCGHDVHLIVPNHEASLPVISRAVKCRLYSARPKGIFGARRIRWLSYSVMVRRFLRALAPFDTVIFTNYLFLGNAEFAKRLCPTARLVHYGLEYYRPNDVWPMDFLRPLEVYRKALPFFDLHVDVEPTRARLRRDDYGLATDPLVLPNTIPLAMLPTSTIEVDIETVASFHRKSDCPILFYSGANGYQNGVDTIIDSLSAIDRPFMFVAFMYEGERKNSDVRRLAEAKLGAERVRILDPLPREQLYSVMRQADCAIGYYDPDVSTNFRHCAPSKVYEYIANGLPVVFSSNPSMIELIEKNQLGVCARNASAPAITEALQQILFNRSRCQEIRSRARTLFQAELCFERASREVVAAISHFRV